MANTKDFIVKNAVEVGGSVKTTVGTITSSDIDLSTGNYFNDTLAANTTYTFSNAGDVQSFQLEVTGAIVLTGSWDVSAATHTQNFSVSTQSPTSSGLFFKPDGTKMYVLEDSFDYEIVYQYSLSTAWDVSTASYDSVNFDVSSEDRQTTDLFFSSDGAKMFIVGNGNNSIYEYDLSTAWDVSTASYNSSISISSQESTPMGLTFSTDGTKMYVVGYTNQTAYQYSLSTAWDLSTAAYANKSFSVSSQETTPEGMFFKSDGTKMFIIGSSGDDINEYDLSTAWDVSTASYSQNFSVSSQQTAPKGIFFKSDGTKMFIVGVTSQQVSEYSVGSSSAATITWPSSIQWPQGLAANAPENDKTALFTFVTDDGGTSYIGTKISNIS